MILLNHSFFITSNYGLLIPNCLTAILLPLGIVQTSLTLLSLTRKIPNS